MNCEYEPVDKSVKWFGMQMRCTSQWGAVPKLSVVPASFEARRLYAHCDHRAGAKTLGKIFAAYAGGPECRSQHPPKEPGVAMRML